MAQQANDRLRHVAAVGMAQLAGRALGNEQRPAVQQAPEVALDAPEGVAFAVHHRQSQAGGREALIGPGGAEHVFGLALVDAIAPVHAIIRVLRLR
jgi:hypothetical protein